MSAAELPSTVGVEDNSGLLAYEGKPTKQSSPDEFVLEHVIGLTDVSAQALACNQLTGFVAFPAACILVLLDPKTNEQRFMESPTSKNLSCVTFSDDGRLVAFGESGVKPYISVWQVKEHKPLNKFVVDHSCGLKELIFGPQSRFLVSLGSHDFKINVWNFAKGERLASASWQTAPLAMTIPKDSNVLVVCGRRKIMLISIEGVHSNDYETNVMMDKKAVLLGPQSEYTFVAVVPGKGRYQNQVYAITACGYLCEITLRDMLIGKAAKIDTFAQCLVFGIDYLFIGCAQGIVKICDPASLSVAATVSLHQLLGSRVGPNLGLAKVGDVSAIAIDERNSIVTCIYTDCSIYSWQVKAHNDVLECSILLPGPESSKDGQSNESSLYEQKQRVSLLRTFLGNSDQMRTHMMSDPNSLSSRSRHHGFHGIQQLFTQRKPLCQHVNSIRISPDGSEIIAGNDVGEIKVYDVTSGALRRVIEAHNSQVTFIELMYDDDYRLVCTGGRDRIIFVLNSKSDFSLVQVLCEHSAAITAISLVHNENQLSLVSAAADGLILIRHAQLAQGTIKFTLTGQVADTRSSQLFANSNSYLAVGAKSGNIELFRTDAFFPSKVHRTIKCHTSATHPAVFKSIDIDPSGSFLVAGRGNGQTTVYHLQTGQPVASLTSQCGVTAVKFTSDLKFIVSSSSTGCALIWRLPERMTEMMKSKQQKVEVAKEISYEAYVSCVRVCQELTECEDGEEQRSPEERGTHAQSGPNSNMNSEWAATPSIESLNLLECTSGCEPSCSAPSEDVHDDDDHDGCSSKGTGDVFDQCSLCSNNSFLSCSTCTGTLSGVETNEASSTDTSAAINTLSIPATSPIWGVAGEEKGKQREEKKENEDEKETETTESSSTPATSNAQLHNPPENEQQQQKEQEQEQEMEHLRQKVGGHHQNAFDNTAQQTAVSVRLHTYNAASVPLPPSPPPTPLLSHPDQQPLSHPIPGIEEGMHDSCDEQPGEKLVGLSSTGQVEDTIVDEEPQQTTMLTGIEGSLAEVMSETLPHPSESSPRRERSTASQVGSQDEKLSEVHCEDANPLKQKEYGISSSDNLVAQFTETTQCQVGTRSRQIIDSFIASSPITGPDPDSESSNEPTGSVKKSSILRSDFNRAGIGADNRLTFLDKKTTALMSGFTFNDSSTFKTVLTESAQLSISPAICKSQSFCSSADVRADDIGCMTTLSIEVTPGIEDTEEAAHEVVSGVRVAAADPVINDRRKPPLPYECDDSYSYRNICRDHIGKMRRIENEAGFSGNKNSLGQPLEPVSDDVSSPDQSPSMITTHSEDVPNRRKPGRALALMESVPDSVPGEDEGISLCDESSHLPNIYNTLREKNQAGYLDKCSRQLRRCMQLSNSQETFYKLRYNNEKTNPADVVAVSFTKETSFHSVDFTMSLSDTTLTKEFSLSQSLDVFGALDSRSPEAVATHKEDMPIPDLKESGDPQPLLKPVSACHGAIEQQNSTGARSLETSLSVSRTAEYSQLTSTSSMEGDALLITKPVPPPAPLFPTTETTKEIMNMVKNMMMRRKSTGRVEAPPATKSVSPYRLGIAPKRNSPSKNPESPNKGMNLRNRNRFDDINVMKSNPHMGGTVLKTFSSGKEQLRPSHQWRDGNIAVVRRPTSSCPVRRCNDSIFSSPQHPSYQPVNRFAFRQSEEHQGLHRRRRANSGARVHPLNTGSSTRNVLRSPMRASPSSARSQSSKQSSPPRFEPQQSPITSAVDLRMPRGRLTQLGVGEEEKDTSQLAGNTVKSFMKPSKVTGMPDGSPQHLPHASLPPTGHLTNITMAGPMESPQDGVKGARGLEKLSCNAMEHNCGPLTTGHAPSGQPSPVQKSCLTGSEDGLYSTPIMRLFREQDDYLERLKEVRQNFEMSIRALSRDKKWGQKGEDSNNCSSNNSNMSQNKSIDHKISKSNSYYSDSSYNIGCNSSNSRCNNNNNNNNNSNNNSSSYHNNSRSSSNINRNNKSICSSSNISNSNNNNSKYNSSRNDRVNARGIFVCLHVCTRGCARGSHKGFQCLGSG